MWLLKLIDISGIGSELGMLSISLILLLTWFIRREMVRLEKKLDELIKQHKELYEDYKYRRWDKEKADQLEDEHKVMYEDFIVRRKRTCRHTPSSTRSRRGISTTRLGCLKKLPSVKKV